MLRVDGVHHQDNNVVRRAGERDDAAGAALPPDARCTAGSSTMRSSATRSPGARMYYGSSHVLTGAHGGLRELTATCGNSQWLTGIHMDSW